jgi:hypothetical protein
MLSPNVDDLSYYLLSGALSGAIEGTRGGGVATSAMSARNAQIL